MKGKNDDEKVAHQTRLKVGSSEWKAVTSLSSVEPRPSARAHLPSYSCLADNVSKTKTKRKAEMDCVSGKMELARARYGLGTKQVSVKKSTYFLVGAPNKQRILKNNKVPILLFVVICFLPLHIVHTV